MKGDGMGLEDSVRAWLDKHGYPLEMKVAETLRASGAAWDHGRVYTDPETQKTREIDLVGYFDYFDNIERFAVHPVFECKHSKDKPWVLFSTHGQVLSRQGFVAGIPATKRATAAISKCQNGDRLHNMLMFKAPELTGFNLTKAHTENQDAAFHAVHGITKSSIALADYIGQFNHMVVYPPVVVVDAPLLQCYMPENHDDLIIQQVSHGVLVHSLGDETGRTVIHIVHIDSLPAFLREMRKDSQILRDVIREQDTVNKIR